MPILLQNNCVLSRPGSVGESDWGHSYCIRLSSLVRIKALIVLMLLTQGGEESWVIALRVYVLLSSVLNNSMKAGGPR